MANAEDLCFGVNLNQPAAILESVEDHVEPSKNAEVADVDVGSRVCGFQKRHAVVLEHADLESVEFDRARGEDNVARIQKVVAEQRAVFQRVHSKAVDEDSEGGPEPAEVVRPRHTNPTYPYENVKLVTKKGMFNPTRVYNACDMANEIVHKKVCQERFQRRRRQCIDNELKRNEALKEQHEAADRCAISRQRELLEKQEARSGVAQHRRGEQQKMLFEIKKTTRHGIREAPIEASPATRL